MTEAVIIVLPVLTALWVLLFVAPKGLRRFLVRRDREAAEEYRRRSRGDEESGGGHPLY